ncbi:glycosyltransferase family 61 protein [Methylobacterium sp. 77]|uniref:glycosyltransferase family 61 protein n=1 Tax=Methylobacterium sp. 77 TaxID=1101192 RepID=UPI0003775D14|nr:glycosyltransferase family 61 protein [Methylobacterium sp. 77]
MAMFIRAAGETQDADALGWAEGQCLDAGWPHADRHAVSRKFLLLGESAAAWKIFTADPSVFKDPKFARQAKSFLAHTKDAALRSEITAALSEAGYVSPGSATESRAATAITFPFPDSERRAQGTVEIRSSERTPSHHAAAVIGDIEGFGKRAARAKPPEIIEYRDVFVDRDGQIWREDGSVVVSKGLPVSRLSREGAPTITAGFFAIKGTRGIYHWLVDRLPLFSWMLEDAAPEAAILLSDQAPPFEKETLRLSGLPQQVVDVGDALFVRRLLVARSGMQGLTYWERVAPIIERVKQSARAIAIQENATAPDALYICRRDSDRRALRNEAEIEAQVVARGYASVMLGRMPLWQQIFIVSSATRIVAPHGAGLAHIVFAEPGTRITEIIPIQDGTYRLRLNFARLSLVMGHRYRAWMEPHIGALNSWDVDGPAFLRFLDEDRSGGGSPGKAGNADDRSRPPR